MKRTEKFFFVKTLGLKPFSKFKRFVSKSYSGQIQVDFKSRRIQIVEFISWRTQVESILCHGEFNSSNWRWGEFMSESCSGRIHIASISNHGEFKSSSLRKGEFKSNGMQIKIQTGQKNIKSLHNSVFFILIDGITLKNDKSYLNIIF